MKTVFVSWVCFDSWSEHLKNIMLGISLALRMKRIWLNMVTPGPHQRGSSGVGGP